MASTARFGEDQAGHDQDCPEIGLCMDSSTRSIFFAAWIVNALLDRSLQFQFVESCDDVSSSPSVTGRISLDRFRHAAHRLALTKVQQVAVDKAVSQLQPLIALYLQELDDRQYKLSNLDPEENGYQINAAKICSRIGMLATQLSLTSCKLREDISNILDAEQQEIACELRDALRTPQFHDVVSLFETRGSTRSPTEGEI